MNLMTHVKKYLTIAVIYAVLAIGFYNIGAEEIRYTKTEKTAIDPTWSVGEIIQDVEIVQEFSVADDVLEKITTRIANCERQNSGQLFFEISDKDSGEVYAQDTIDVAQFLEDTDYEWYFPGKIQNAKGKNFVWKITSDCQPGSAVTLYYNQNEKTIGTQLYINGEAQNGELDFGYVEAHKQWFGTYYWYIIAAVAILFLIYQLASNYREKRGKVTFEMYVRGIWKRYGFLIRQLVSRDFKTKYKRSVLGYLWSFLNPLLSMVVQYIVFSTIFRSGIKNFPVYLLSGIVLFSFFTDAVGQGLNAILANSSLITKVYVPKYIYPVTKILSSSINLFISIVPLFMVMIITGQSFSWAMLLLPFPLMCLLVFSIGLGLALCSSMVFFRDTMYLWGIASLAWTYATPIFYPANIIPDKFKWIQQYNPLYHFIRFTRTLLLDGVSPAPIEYLYCFIFSFGMLAIGALIFKKTQDKFVLYI